MRVNRTFAAMVGREQAELVGLPTRDITHAEDARRDRAATRADARRRGRIPIIARSATCAPTAPMVWASLAVMIVRDGGEPSHLLAQTIDITDRKVFEEALATSEERFRSLSASAPNGIYAIDIEGRLLYSNDRLVELTGFEHDQLAGTGWLDMIHPDERERVIRESGPTALNRRLAIRGAAVAGAGTAKPPRLSLNRSATAAAHGCRHWRRLQRGGGGGSYCGSDEGHPPVLS